jgi:hypothetical protein
VRRLGIGAAPRAALVTVLLLIRPVELEELGARLREMIGAGGELRREIAAQARAFLLHLLDRAQRLLVGHVAHRV